MGSVGGGEEEEFSEVSEQKRDRKERFHVKDNACF